MARILQSLVPRKSIPVTLRKFIPETRLSHRVQQGIPETDPYWEMTPEAPARPVPPQNDQLNSPLRGAYSRTSSYQENQGGNDHRKTGRRSP